jgi:polar amino acid transport system permease protein
VSIGQTQAGSRPPQFQSHALPITDRLTRLPYWLLAALLLAVIAFWVIFRDEDLRVIFDAVSKGISTTIYVSLVAFIIAIFAGLGWCLLRVSNRRLSQEISSFFVEIIRGVPMLVLLYYISFVGAPAMVSLLNWLGQPLIHAGLMQELVVRQFDFVARAILALSIGYSAFISEIFRAGIQSIEKEQTEAAQTEGANYWQIMRFILLPQAVRNVLPALGNEFIAMLKDSALVSALGVQDITQLGKVYSASTFNFFGTYSIAALLYLVMTLGLAVLMRWVQKRLQLA